jgi:hypothetical protein
MIGPDCHKDLPRIERSLIPPIVELRHKDLPLLRFRNHSTAKKIDHLFIRNSACYARIASTRGKAFMAKWQNLSVNVHKSLAPAQSIRGSTTLRRVQSQTHR